MKRYLVLGLAFIFAVFLSGTGIVISYLVRGSLDLREVVELHQVEELRLRLSLQAHHAQNDLKVSKTAFAADLDGIIANVRSLESQVQFCFSCHHDPVITEQLDELVLLLDEYKNRFSRFVTFVTTTDNEDGRNVLQLEAAAVGEQLQAQIDSLLLMALPGLEGRTREAVTKIDRSRQVLSITLLLTLVSAVLVAVILSRRLARPVQLLASASEKISAGHLGFQIHHRETGEFGNLIKAFNAMSAALYDNKVLIQASVQKLVSLGEALPGLHATRGSHSLPSVLSGVIENLIAAGHFGFAAKPDPEADTYDFFLFSAGDEKATLGRELPAQVLEEAHRAALGLPLMVNREAPGKWPLGAWPFEEPLQNFLITWLEIQGQVGGVLFVANKTGGGFQNEDSGLLAILSSGLAEALENNRLFDELNQKMGMLRETQHELVQAEKLSALGTLSSGVAHDFNNILCAILGHAQLLKASGASMAEKESLSTIEQASYQGAALTKKLLSFSYPSPPEFKDFGINESVRRVVQLITRALGKRIELVLELADPEPIVRADAGEIEQVVMNLCVNARDAMQSTGRLLVRTEEVELEPSFRRENQLAYTGSYVRLTVGDTGGGIPEELLSRIFDPFFTTKRDQKGTGLGLSILQRIVQNHGGACSVESAVGEGTQFQVYLPISTGETQVSSVVPVSLSVTGKQVLIVDDEEMICSFLGDLMHSQGFSVLVAHNGRVALDLLASQDGEIDLMILDLNMPVMGGEEVLEAIARNGHRVRVLAISGGEVRDQTQRLLNKTSTAFLRKPFAAEELAAKVQELFLS